MTARKLASVSGTAVVAAIAAYASYEHMRALALAAGQTPGIAAVLPFSVDGMILVASVALVDGRQRKASAWVAFGLGVLASVLANVLAAGPTLTDRCVSAWPSVALLATVEVIARGGSRTVPLAADTSLTVAPVLAPAPVAVASPVYTQPRTAEPAELAPVNRADTTADEATTDSPGTSDKPRRRAPRAEPSNRVKVERAHERSPEASVSELARLARVSESTARRYRPATAVANA
jgi:hypothetical protein